MNIKTITTFIAAMLYATPQTPVIDPLVWPAIDNNLFFDQRESYDYTTLSKTEHMTVYETSCIGGYLPLGSLKVFVIPKNKMKFGVSTEKPTDKDFFLNSNFFGEQDPIGLVVIDKKRRSSRVRGGGYFYVKNGTPHVQAYSSPPLTEHNSQTLLVGINNGKANRNIMKAESAKKKNYRSLVGEDSSGNIVIVVSSSRLGLVTIEDIVSIGLDFNIQDGILFDGGPSVDYKMRDGFYKHSFKAMSGLTKKSLDIDEPMVYIYGDFRE
tara:strand:+ start:3548 stop:4348 length:801 start_codon:yes stop_codon:yes gene_type:complete